MKFLIFVILLFRATEIIAAEYNNPVDGKTYVTEEWTTYHPQKPKHKTEKRVMMSGIRLLTTEEDIERNLTTNQLIGYMKSIEKHANITLEGESNGVVLLQVSLNPDVKAKYHMSFQGELSQESLQKFYDALSNLSYPRVKVSNVTFQVEFSVK